uniref:C2H2-type domain-containing protein n=1 Tax=Timema bartmani TaxID=61472 RepID=A0A7R9I374_9NEOP|nr:unnamed protein product [Timema bartmani]
MEPITSACGTFTSRRRSRLHRLVALLPVEGGYDQIGLWHLNKSVANDGPLAGIRSLANEDPLFEERSVANDELQHKTADRKTIDGALWYPFTTVILQSVDGQILTEVKMPQQRSSRRGSGYHRGSSNRYPYQGSQWRQEFQSRQSSQDNFLSQLTSPEATLAIASNLISTLLQSQQTQVTWAADATNSGNMGKALARYSLISVGCMATQTGVSLVVAEEGQITGRGANTRTENMGTTTTMTSIESYAVQFNSDKTWHIHCLSFTVAAITPLCPRIGSLSFVVLNPQGVSQSHSAPLPLANHDLTTTGPSPAWGTPEGSNRRALQGAHNRDPKGSWHHGSHYRERTTGTQRGRGIMGARGRGGSNKQPMRGKAAGKKDEVVDKKRRTRSIKLAQNMLEHSPNQGSGGANVAYFMQNSKEKSKDPDKTKDDTEKKKILSKYAGVPDMLFFCHICNKHLWDAQCFDKHLTGRPHTETFERQREGYKLKTLLLRKKLKVALLDTHDSSVLSPPLPPSTASLNQCYCFVQLNTEKMELELDSPQPKKPRIQQFCAMCDTHYYGGVVLHRRTWDHQVGTTCRTCSHEVVTTCKMCNN